MGMMMRHLKGRTVPVLTCDACGEDIEGNGNVVFAWPDKVEGERQPVRFVHKGGCDSAQRLKPSGELWMGLPVYLGHLIHNAKLPDVAEASRKNVELNEMLG